DGVDRAFLVETLRKGGRSCDQQGNQEEKSHGNRSVQADDDGMHRGSTKPMQQRSGQRKAAQEPFLRRLIMVDWSELVKDQCAIAGYLRTDDRGDLDALGLKPAHQLCIAGNR